MKIKITSLFLMVSLLISLFAIYIFPVKAQVTSSKTDSYVDNYLHYRNSFGNGTDDVGSTIQLTNSQLSCIIPEIDDKGNNYGKYVFNDPSSNVYFQISPKEAYNPSTDALGYLILEMDFNDFGKSVTTNKMLDVNSGKGTFSSGNRVAAPDIINIANDSTGNYFYFCNNKGNKIYYQSNTWVHIRIEFSILKADATHYSLKCYIGDKSFESSFPLGNPSMVTEIRIGSSNSTGVEFGLDNITLYSSPKNIPSYSEIDRVGCDISMKIGAENASINGVSRELSNVPLLIDGQVYCPVDILKELTSIDCPSEFTEIFNNAEYIHINNIYNVFGVTARSYDMGLILIGKEEDLLRSDASYTEILSVLKNFVFNIPTPDSIIDDVRTYTNGFDHPYLLADANKFSYLRGIYQSGQANNLTNAEDKALYDYINKYVTTAVNHLNSYTGSSEISTYTGIKSDRIPVNKNYSNYSNNGYDEGGRLSANTTPLLYFAFAYQMTGHLNYARAAYDYILALGDWNHWGPDHFLNCADTAAPVAITYDWLFDAFEKLNSNGELSKHDGQIYDKGKIANILFTHVIVPGYVQSNNLTCPWPGTAKSRYSTKTSNWNAVCTSGVVMSALVLLEEDVSVAGMTFDTQIRESNGTFTQTVTPIESIGNKYINIGLDTISDYASKLTSMNLGTLAKYGLDQYVPDGSYVESPGYWSYGTNAFFRLIASLLSATGDDYGFMDAWGIDTTCYFAIHSESSDYKTWNFNDGSIGAQDSSFFFFVGEYYGDDNLIKVRKKHLSQGKGFTIYDILFFDSSITGEPNLATEYQMVGIDAYSVRSSWDRGAIYAGIIGGPNKVSHGQMDAGSFIYHNKGKVWFHDLGADNYNMDIGYFSNYKLYRVGAEGHNILTITNDQSSLPYGQSVTADPKIIKTNSSDLGGYAILDMSDAYGSKVVSGKRGILFTDSRSTVVIQDEYVFNGSTTAYWFGHYQIASGYVDDVIISSDGRYAFMISGSDILRVSIVSDNKDLKFEIMDCYTYLLDITHRTDRTTMGASKKETSRDTLRKLAIKCENVTDLNLAVVIEEVDGYSFGTNYKFTNMDNWQLSSTEKPNITTKFEADFQKTSSTTGSYVLDSESYSLEERSYDDHRYIAVLPTNVSSSTKESVLNFHFRNNLSINIEDNNLVSFDFDIFSESKLTDNTELGINTILRDGSMEFISLIKLVDNAIVSGNKSYALDNSWVHVVLLIDTDKNILSVYVNDELLVKTHDLMPSDASIISKITLRLPNTSNSINNSSILLDNIKARSFSNSYPMDDLDEILSTGMKLSNWNDAESYENYSIPLAKAGSTYLYTNSSIEAAISQGNNITLLRDTVGTINVSRRVTVNTNGYDFAYCSASFLPTISGNLLIFSSNKLTVSWHIDGEIITEIYTAAQIATFKDYSFDLDKITYTVSNNNDGGVEYKFYKSGWASYPGGPALDPDDMIVSERNCNFFLVNNAPLDCLYVTIDTSGLITPEYTSAAFQRAIANNSGIKDIVLCGDIELTNTSAISLSNNGKNIYLNGYTISHKQFDSHIFLYQSTTNENFNFIGPGRIQAIDSRTIFTSSSSTSDVTSSYGIVARNVDFITNGQFADLRIGQHKFIDCSIEQHDASKSLIALWNKNTKMQNGIPINLLSITFDGCSIKTDISSKYALFSYTNYSEVYINNTTVISNATLLEDSSASSKLYVDKGSSLFIGKISSNSMKYSNLTFGNGVTINIEIPSYYLVSGAVLTNNYETMLPYKVSMSYANVNWTDINGNVIHSEYAAVGSMPKVSSTVSDYLKTIGTEYTYDIRVINDTNQVTLSPVFKTGVSLRQSMTINEDLTLNIYIKKADWNKINSFKVDDLLIQKNMLTGLIIDGVDYYKYSISDIKPSYSCNVITITFEQLDGKTVNIKTSIIDYLEGLLISSSVESEKVLAIKLIKYVQSAYDYFRPECKSEYVKLGSIIDKYKKYDVVFESHNEESVATGVLKDSIQSVCFDISCAVKIRFKLNPSYSGTLIIKYNGSTNTYHVSNGYCDGRNYIEVRMPADSINESLLISNSQNEITYSLGAYTTSNNHTDIKLHRLLEALASYSSAANQYLN